MACYRDIVPENRRKDHFIDHFFIINQSEMQSRRASWVLRALLHVV